MRDGGKPNHKYRIITDQKSVDTSWKQVPEAYYRLHENNLGLTLMSKPAGVFEEDASKVAAPPGYNYVGNSRYGEMEVSQRKLLLGLFMVATASCKTFLGPALLLTHLPE